jgi:hypothetical protein
MGKFVLHNRVQRNIEYGSRFILGSNINNLLNGGNTINRCASCIVATIWNINNTILYLAMETLEQRAKTNLSIAVEKLILIIIILYLAKDATAALVCII